MYYPSVGERVRVRGREGEFIVVSVNHAAYAADIHLQTHPTTVEKNVRFEVLAGLREIGPLPLGSYHRHSRRLLRSTREQMARAHILFADIQDSILATLHSIRISQQRIQESDRVIARARNLDCNGGKKEA